MEYRIMLKLQKCLYVNIHLFIIWALVVVFFLYVKFHSLGHLTKYLSVTVFALLILIESVRLCLGHFGNLSCRVPELAGFLMLTVLMQMPLVSYFLFNPYLQSTPTELTLHTILWLTSLLEVFYSYKALKQASSLAQSVYLLHSVNS